MDFSDDWKSLWPISAVFSAPLLISGGGASSSSEISDVLGPLFFNPSPETLTPLFASPSLSPPFPPPYPRLSLSRFLETTEDASSLLPSTSSSVAGKFGAQLPDDAASALRHNRLQLLRCGPKSNSVIVFFLTGENSDQVGFVVLTVKDGKLKTIRDGDDVFRANCRMHHRILRLSVNTVAVPSSRLGNYCFTTVGYLLACTLYSVHWFRVKIWGLGTDSERLVLENVGSRFFKSCSVLHACWNPHLPEESIVFLENGELYLFDLESLPRTHSSNMELRGKRMRVLWNDSTTIKSGRWLSCEFSWHPRILIVAHSKAVFLVDLRYEECNVNCLLKIEELVMYSSAQDDKFVAFSRAGSDGFRFTVASEYWLLLCDIRRPLMPLLQWGHNLANPSYISVIPLSELRSQSKSEKYNWASESGYCIIMGSFWNAEFGLFCYGPPTGGSISSQVSKFNKSLYAWELPSDLSLLGCECPCGSCIVREEFSKDAFPEWVDWRQKKELVLGFGILDKDLSAQLCESVGFGGFTLIRLVSSGKLELQRYSASWKLMDMAEENHKGSCLYHEDSLLYEVNDEKYKFTKRFKYLKLDYLRGYMNGGLIGSINKKVNRPHGDSQEMDISGTNFHRDVCEKLKACGFKKLRSSSVVPDALKDIRLLTSIHEIAFKSIWTGLPVDLLMLAFSSYSEFREVLLFKNKASLEFSGIPHQPQLPPFFFRPPSARSSKWSKKVQPGEAVAGPVLPLPILPVLHKLRTERDIDIDISAVETELTLKCNEVLQVANKMAVSGAGSDINDDYAVSLADDREEMCYGSQREKNLCLHEPVAIFDTFSSTDATSKSSFNKDTSFMTFVFKTSAKDSSSKVGTDSGGADLFSSLCPIKLTYQNHDTSYGFRELKAYTKLKRQYSTYLDGFNLYQDYLTRSNCQK